MITERTLRRWRRDALKGMKEIHSLPAEGLNIQLLHLTELYDRILSLTQELLDQHLIRGGGK